MKLVSSNQRKEMEPKNCNAIVLSLFCHRRSHADPDRPTVPVMMPVLLKDCMEELLKFTLTSSMNGEIDVGLSKDYCSRLLEDDPSNPFSSSIGTKYACFTQIDLDYNAFSIVCGSCSLGDSHTVILGVIKRHILILLRISFIPFCCFFFIFYFFCT